MANVSYTSTQAVTLATRGQAYALLADMLLHCDALNINVISIVRNGDNTVTVTLSAPIRADHLDGGQAGAACSRWGLGAGV